MDTTTRRLSESAGMLMIGDGVLGLLHPREHCLLWRGGPPWWRSTIDWFAAHPQAVRGVAAGEIAAGVWIAWRQEACRQRTRQPGAAVGEVAARQDPPPEAGGLLQ